MCHGHGGVTSGGLAEQESGHGAPNDVGTPNDHGVLARGIVATTQEHFDDAPRRTRRHHIQISCGEATHVDGMKAVHVLGRVNRHEHLGLLDLLRQR